MQLATISYKGMQSAVLVKGDHVRVLPYAGLKELLDAGPSADRLDQEAGQELPSADVTFLQPIITPEKTICVGLNFRGHAIEAGFALPDHPTLFAKYGCSLIGPYDEIEMPSVSTEVDWEAELGLIIGKRVRFASEAEAAEAIAGYTVVNDISMRDWQMRTSQFLQGKTFERSTPVGPVMITPDEVDHARDLALWCSVNGEEMQRSTTADMIFSPAEIVAYVSQIMTLVPGDLIACGTPAGIGGLRKPPVYLRSGDVVTTGIEGIGVLTNRCAPVTGPAVAR